MTKSEWALNMQRDAVWNELVAEMKQTQISRFSASAPEDYEVRDDAYRRLRFIDELESHIDALAMTQKIESKRWKIL